MAENLIIPIFIALVLAFAAIVCAFIFYRFGDTEANSISLDLMEKIKHLKFSIGLFTAELLGQYTTKMIENQPFDNDRLLPGTGKNHTLEVIARMSDKQNDIPSVFNQIGDIFS